MDDLATGKLELAVALEGGVVRCRASGELTAREADRLYRTLAKHLRRGAVVHLSLAGITAADAVAAASLAAALDLADEHRGELVVSDLSPAVQARLNRTPAQATPSQTDRPGLLYALGDAAHRGWLGLVAWLLLLSESFFGAFTGLFSSRSRRRGAVTRNAVAIGVDAVPVVATIGLLLGLILAFQAGYLLKDFGTSIFVANLVGVGMVREFGPLMTAIVVAGRSGSAIAAEIGAMKTNEELDALKVMGIEPTRFLVVPALYAVTFTQPLLAVIASFAAIFGGFLIGVTYLNLGSDVYINQTIQSLSLGDVANCVGKSIVFGWLIILIGAHNGFRVKGGAEGVGRAATRAVVASIFAIIVADGIITTVNTLSK